MSIQEWMWPYYSIILKYYIYNDMCVYIFTNISSTIIINIFSLSLKDETTHQLLRPSLVTQKATNSHTLTQRERDLGWFGLVRSEWSGVVTLIDPSCLQISWFQLTLLLLLLIQVSHFYYAMPFIFSFSPFCPCSLSRVLHFVFLDLLHFIGFCTECWSVYVFFFFILVLG